MNYKPNLTVFIEHRFFEYQGKLYTKLSFPYAYWSEYLRTFSEVEIAARVLSVKQLEAEMCRVDGPGVKFYAIPYYVGPTAFLMAVPIVFFRILLLTLKRRRFLLRSGNISNLAWLCLMMQRKAYLREYPGDISDALKKFMGPGIIPSIISTLSGCIARTQGRYSAANSFVSESVKRIYSSSKPSYVFSSFNYEEIRGLKKTAQPKNRRCNQIIAVGRLEPEKGHKILIEAFLRLKLTDTQLHIVGDGRQAKKLKQKYVSESIIFHGPVTERQSLVNLLCSADLFVLPSLTEGMPRALLEAMACGLPCIGSEVGGVPEVLENDFLAKPGSVTELSKLIHQLSVNAELRHSQGRRNAEFISRDFSKAALAEKKRRFWSHIL